MRPGLKIREAARRNAGDQPPFASPDGVRMASGPWPSLALLAFLLVSLQAAFLRPYVLLLPGDRTNLFTAVLALVPTALLWRRCAATGHGFWFSWGVMGLGLAWAAMQSLESTSSLARAFAFWAPAAGGLYASRELLRGPEQLKLFLHFLTACFAALVGAHLILGQGLALLGLHHHALAGMLVLLSAGPIYLACSGQGLVRYGAGLLLVSGYALALFEGSRFLALLPLVFIPLFAVRGQLRFRWALALGAAAVAFAVLFFLARPDKIPQAYNYESVFYRLEGFPVSWNILRQQWLTGIGIHASRMEWMKDYSLYFNIVDRGYFMAVLERNVTADNQYLSLLVGIGVPLTCLYLWLVGVQVRSFARALAHGVFDNPTRWALTLPLLATFLHLCIYDGLFYPQICWFFHVLLGAGAQFDGARPDGQASPRA